MNFSYFAKQTSFVTIFLNTPGNTGDSVTNHIFILPELLSTYYFEDYPYRL